VRESFDPFCNQKVETRPALFKLDKHGINRWLEDFHASAKPFDVTEVKGVIVELSMNKEGSRLLQEAIGNSPSSLQLVFEELQDHLMQVSMDQCGN